MYNTPEVRTIGPDGAQIGVIKTTEALAKAKQSGLDLVEVAPNSKPPVCRILDYGKYKYEEAKKAKAAKAKQHIVKTKEIKLHPKTDVNDYNYRVARAKEFLNKGFKVKATIVFKGREMAHISYGARWIKQLVVDFKECANIDSPARQEGRNLTVTFAPLKAAQRKQIEKQKEQEAKEKALNEPDTTSQEEPAQ